MNIEKHLYLYLKSLNEKTSLSNQDIYVGFSGGIDSTALLVLLKKLQSTFNYNLHAISFMHANTPIVEPLETYDFTETLCKNLGIDYKFIKLDILKSNKGWETASRKARQNYYEVNSFDNVFLGHHLDDQNENTLIQLFRGAGNGMTGMKKQSSLNNVMYHRPFLDLEKEALTHFLIANNISWIEDKTNENSDFTRNFFRNNIITSLKKYYPEYSQKLSLFRKKQNEQQELSIDIAKTDGLEFLLSKETVDISNLSTLRIKNLLKVYLNSQKIFKPDNWLNEQVKYIQKEGVLKPIMDSNKKLTF